MSPSPQLLPHESTSACPWAVLQAEVRRVIGLLGLLCFPYYMHVASAWLQQRQEPIRGRAAGWHNEVMERKPLEPLKQVCLAGLVVEVQVLAIILRIGACIVEQCLKFGSVSKQRSLFFLVKPCSIGPRHPSSQGVA